EVSFMIVCSIILSCTKRALPEREDSITTIEVAHAETRLMKNELVQWGTVTYQKKADIYPPFESTLLNVLVQEGDRVEKDEVLALLDTELLTAQLSEAEAEAASRLSLYQLACEKLNVGERDVRNRITAIEASKASLLKAEAEFSFLQAQYQKRLKLLEAGGISTESLESLFASLEQARASVIEAQGEYDMLTEGYSDKDILKAGLGLPGSEEERIAALTGIHTRTYAAERDAAMYEHERSQKAAERMRLLLKKASITSPLSGVIGARYAEEGERVTPDIRLFTVFNADSVYVDIEVSEKDLDKVKDGQGAVLVCDPGGAEIKGRVTTVLPFINPETRSSRVRVSAENSMGVLKPGQYIPVRIERGSPVAVVSIPKESAVIGADGRALVFIIRNGRLFRKEIPVDESHDDFLTTDGSLEPGDTLCLHPSLSFQDGMRVNISEAQ
ncbi:MAG TPA: efflux RND transporter periplasmic adaptor subunit, partial [Spirochaetia bacterium]|nr:efflux RND transporter periplasmic adaptor subunit [Spirochaetia bacterium]